MTLDIAALMSVVRPDNAGKSGCRHGRAKAPASRTHSKRFANLLPWRALSRSVWSASGLPALSRIRSLISNSRRDDFDRATLCRALALVLVEDLLAQAQVFRRGFNVFV